MKYTCITSNGISGYVESEHINICLNMITSLIFGGLCYVFINNYYKLKYYHKKNSTSESESEWTDIDDDDDDDNDDNDNDNDNENKINNEEPTDTKFQQSQQAELNLCKPQNADLSARMKYYEEYTEKHLYQIDAETPFIVRLDGRCFSKLLTQIKQKEYISMKAPLSYDFKKAMDLTTMDLVKEFNVSCGYNHSDEISLVFKPLLQKSADDTTRREHIFGGRVQKLISVMPSFASVRLSYHLNQINQEKFKDISSLVSFDGRCLIFPSNFEVVNYFVWRSKYDCFRNFVSELAYNEFPKKSLTNISTYERQQKLKQKNIDVYDYNHTLLYGTYVKRQLIKHTNEDKEFYRTKYISFTMPNTHCTVDYVDILYDQHFELDKFSNCEFELIMNI